MFSPLKKPLENFSNAEFDNFEKFDMAVFVQMLSNQGFKDEIEHENPKTLYEIISEKNQNLLNAKLISKHSPVSQKINTLKKLSFFIPNSQEVNDLEVTQNNIIAFYKSKRQK